MAIVQCIASKDNLLAVISVSRACTVLNFAVLYLSRSGEAFNGTFTATLTETAIAGIAQSAVYDDTAHVGEVHSRAETRFHETVGALYQDSLSSARNSPKEGHADSISGSSIAHE